MHEQIFGNPKERGVKGTPLAAMALEIAELGRDRATGGLTEPAPLFQLISQNVPFPWGLLYDASAYGASPNKAASWNYPSVPETSEEVDLASFWGLRLAIYRAIRGNPPKALWLDGDTVIPCINPHLDEEQSLAVVSCQRTFFGSLFNSNYLVESKDQFERLLQEKHLDNCKLLYFFCHADAAHTLDENMFTLADISDSAAKIVLDNKDSAKTISIADMRKVHIDPLPHAPLVFLNACGSAEEDTCYPSPFISHFLTTWAACGFIGTDWKVPTVFADQFARCVLRKWAEGGAIVNSFLDIRRSAAKQGNPFGLIYSLFVRPELALRGSISG